MSLVQDGQGKTALDVGCREGYQSEWLKRKGYEVESIDIQSNYKHAKIINANKPLPYPNNFFNLIWCSEVIEYLIDPKQTINEFKRILKDNGEMIITTPNSYFWLYSLLQILGGTPKDLQNLT